MPTTVEGTAAAHAVLDYLRQYRDERGVLADTQKNPFWFIQGALPLLTPDDLFARLDAHLRAEHDAGPLEGARSLKTDADALQVWAARPRMDRYIARGQYVPAFRLHAAGCLWDATPADTRGAVLVASMAYTSAAYSGQVRVDRYGRKTFSATQGGTSVSAAVPAAYMLLDAARRNLHALPYPPAHIEMLAAEVAVSAALRGIGDEEFNEKLDAAVAIIPTFTVDGEPIVPLISAALDEWLHPVFNVGRTWDSMLEDDTKSMEMLAALRGGTPSN